MTASSAGTARSRRSPRGSAGKSGTAGQLLQFARGFIKHPKMVGSIIPSSRQCITRMLRPVDWTATQVFVEYGPGVGTFTRPVLDLLAPDAKLIAIDTNPDFVAYLRREIADPRLHCVAGSAADVRTILGEHGHDHADYILSGLPFSTLPPGVGPQIAEQTAAALRPGGAFLVYQFSPKVRDFLSPHFRRIDRGFEPINIPPAQLFWAYRDAD